MSMAERYVQAVVSRLPEKQREDVAKELRATIEDMAAGRQGPDEKAVREVVAELGDPKVLAENYTGKRSYLIGPDMFPYYLSVLKAVIPTVVPIVFVVLVLVGIFVESESVLRSVFQSFFQSVSVAAGILFWVTAVFAIMERTENCREELLKSVPELEQKAWTPEDLMDAPSGRQLSFGEGLAAVVFSSLWTAFLASLYFGIGEVAGFHHDGRFIPFFNEGLRSFWLPALIGLSLLALMHEAWKLKVGNWTLATALLEVALGVVGIVFLSLLYQQELINPEFLSAMTETTKNQDLESTIHRSIGIGLGVTIVIYLYDMYAAVAGHIKFSRRQ